MEESDMNAQLPLVVIAISMCAAAGVAREVAGLAEPESALENAAPSVELAIGRAADLAPGVELMAGGRPIEVGGFAAPFVGDFDGDGKNDLLVGQYIQGRLRIYRNTGTDAQPQFDTFEWFEANGRIAGVPRCCQVAFTPQLVDFDGDGDTDILTGSGLTGEVFLFRRKADGRFDEAEVLENREGQVLMHRRTREGKTYARRYNVTALAYDWDNDDDADLLLGHYPLCLVLNEGTAGEPSFDSGRLVKRDGHPILGGLASPQMADWDGDGLDEIAVGFGANSDGWVAFLDDAERMEFDRYSGYLMIPVGRDEYRSGLGSSRPAFGNIDDDPADELLVGFGGERGHELQIFDDFVTGGMNAMRGGIGFVTGADVSSKWLASPAR
jgi:hypothetical protein